MRLSTAMKEKLGSSITINGSYTRLNRLLTEKYGILWKKGEEINSTKVPETPEDELLIALFNDVESGTTYVFNITHWRDYAEFLSFLMEMGHRQHTTAYRVPKFIKD